MQLDDPAFQIGERLLGHVELRQPIPRLHGPLQDAVDVGGVLARQRAQLTLPGQLRLERAGIAGQCGQIVAEFACHIGDHRERAVELCGQGLQCGVVGGLHRRLRLSHTVDRRCGSGRRVVVGPGQRGARGLRRLPHRVQLGQPADVLDERVVLAGLRSDGVDLVQSELEPIGLLRELTCPLCAVDQVTARGQPVLAQLPVSLQRFLDVDEAVQGRTLFVGTHQPELIVLAVQREQLSGERAQRLRGHTTAAEVCPRRAVAADGTGGDDAAVVVTFGSRGIQDLVDLDGDVFAEFTCGETAFDDRALGSGAHSGGVCAGATEQVQTRDDHRLAGAGLAGEHGETAIELGGRGADRAQRLDADLG